MNINRLPNCLVCKIIELCYFLSGLFVNQHHWPEVKEILAVWDDLRKTYAAVCWGIMKVCACSKLYFVGRTCSLFYHARIPWMVTFYDTLNHAWLMWGGLRIWMSMSHKNNWILPFDQMKSHLKPPSSYLNLLCDRFIFVIGSVLLMLNW